MMRLDSGTATTRASHPGLQRAAALLRHPLGSHDTQTAHSAQIGYSFFPPLSCLVNLFFVDRCPLPD